MCVGSRARVGGDGHRGGDLAVTWTRVAERETKPRTLDQPGDPCREHGQGGGAETRRHRRTTSGQIKARQEGEK